MYFIIALIVLIFLYASIHFIVSRFSAIQRRQSAVITVCSYANTSINQCSGTPSCEIFADSYCIPIFNGTGSFSFTCENSSSVAVSEFTNSNCTGSVNETLYISGCFQGVNFSCSTPTIINDPTFNLCHYFPPGDYANQENNQCLGEQNNCETRTSPGCITNANSTGSSFLTCYETLGVLLSEYDTLNCTGPAVTVDINGCHEGSRLSCYATNNTEPSPSPSLHKKTQPSPSPSLHKKTQPSPSPSLHKKTQPSPSPIPSSGGSSSNNNLLGLIALVAILPIGAAAFFFFVKGGFSGINNQVSPTN